jgi:NTE family protein
MQTNISKVGLVLSGGGAKGAYQVGVLRYMAEIGMNVDAISGASIGALNGAIISNAKNLNEGSEHLEKLWSTLAEESPLKFNKAAVVPYLGFAMIMGSERLSPVGIAAKLMFDKVKDFEIFEGVNAYLNKLDTGIFDHSPVRDLIDAYTKPHTLQKGLPLYISAYESEELENDLLNTFLAATGISDSKASEFFHVQSFPIEKQQDVILASAALPILFSPQKINGKAYSDGGLGGWQKSQGNTPITPLIEKENCTHIIVTHLTDGSLWNRYDFPTATILEVRPKKPIEKDGMVKDLLGFKADKINQWIEQGYDDAKRCIRNVQRVLEQQRQSEIAIEKRNEALNQLDNDDFLLSAFNN